MSQPRPVPDPLSQGVDISQLIELGKTNPGSIDFVLGLIQKDMDWQRDRIDRLDSRQHSRLVLSIWITAALVLSLAYMSVYVIIRGHGLAGGAIATIDLATVINSIVSAAKS